MSDETKPVTPADPMAGYPTMVEHTPTGEGLDEAAGRILGSVTSAAKAVVPFYDFLSSHLSGLINGTSAAEAHKQMAALQSEYPGASAIGAGAGFLGTLGASAPAALAELSAPARVAANVGINAGLYGTGNVAADLLEGTPLSNEKLFWHIGFPALLTAAVGGAVELPGLTGKVAGKIALNRARRALGLDFTPESQAVASRVLQEGALSELGAMQAVANKESAGEGLSRAAKGIKESPVQVTTEAPPAPATPDWLEPTAYPGEPAAPPEPLTKIVAPVSDKLQELSTLQDKVPEADMARRQLIEAGKRLRAEDVTYKDIHEIQKSFADNARSENIQPASRMLFSEANKYLKGVLESRAPEMGPLAREYAYYSGVAPAAMKAANARMGLKFGGFTVPLPIPNVAQQARAAQSVAEGANSLQESLDNGVGALFAAGAQRMIGEFQADDWKRIEKAIQHVQGDPKGAAERLRLALGNTPPHVKEPVIAHTLAGVDHLAKLHKETVANPHPPLPGADEWEPSGAAKAQFMDAYRVMMDPAYALHNPAPEGFGVLKTVAPAHLEATTKAVASKLAESKEISYDVKQKVSGVLGMPLDATQMPDFGARQQARMKAYRERKAQMGQQNSARTRASTMKADKASVSRAQRIQSEQEQF